MKTRKARPLSLVPYAMLFGEWNIDTGRTRRSVRLRSPQRTLRRADRAQKLKNKPLKKMGLGPPERKVSTHE